MYACMCAVVSPWGYGQRISSCVGSSIRILLHPVSHALVRPSRAGTERCCDYTEPPAQPSLLMRDLLAWILFGSIGFTVFCVATCTLLPLCIGGIIYAIYRSQRKKRLQQQRQRTEASRATFVQPVISQQPIQPASVTVMDPAAQKAAQVAPTVIVAHPTPAASATVYPLL